MNYIAIYDFGVAGLGNCLFQIAAAFDLSLKLGMKVSIPSDWIYLKYFKNLENYIDFDVRLKNPVLYEEKDFHFNSIDLSNEGRDILLKGYFQSEKYFVDCADKIKELFDLNIETKNNACSIHIRRGDYLKKQEYHPVLPISYYHWAVEEVEENTFFVFSDDIKWVSENFDFNSFKKKFVLNQYNSTVLDEISAINDFKAMMNCKNNIIANSTFSWWSAYLNKNTEKIVVAPTKWFGPSYSNLNTKDLIPENWIKI